MIKLSKRLQSVADLVDKESNVLADIGCDHALLDIYLLQSSKIKKAYACDITKGALNQAKINIKKYNIKSIVTVLSDGFSNLKDEYNIDTVVISGMGSSKILEILCNKNNLNSIKTIIIQSNNNAKKVRKHLTKIGYFIEKDDIVKDHDLLYITTKYVFNQNKNSNFEINNIRKKIIKNPLYKEYINNIISKNNNIIRKLPAKQMLKKLKLIFNNYKLKRMINK